MKFQKYSVLELFPTPQLYVEAAIFDGFGLAGLISRTV